MYEIREYKTSDKKQVLKLWFDVAIKEHNFKEWEDEMNILNEDEYEKILVAIFDGTVIATMGYEKSNDDDAELRRAYIYPNHRGTGLAKVLLDEIIKIVKENNYKRLLVGTYKNFKSGRRFYEKNNFDLLYINGDEYKYSLEL